MPDRDQTDSSIVAGVLTDADVQWFAIWTRSRHEQVVRQQLEKKGFESFLPTIPRGAAGKIARKDSLPLFPGIASLDCAGFDAGILSAQGSSISCHSKGDRHRSRTTRSRVSGDW